jgi:hypothetical protein
LAGPKSYEKPRRSSAVIAVSLAAVAAAVTLHAARVMAPPEFGVRSASTARPELASRGYVDTYSLGSAGERPIPPDLRLVAVRRAELRLRGWAAASIVPPVVAGAVAATLDGRPVATTVRALLRPDVAQTFRARELARAGFLVSLRAPAQPGSYALQVVAAAGLGATPYPVGRPLLLVVR